VGDQIVEINGEPTQGITHTRAIELIQAGGNKVLLLLRPGTGLIPDHGDWDINNPSSSNVIYDEQSPFPPSSHSAFIFGESHVPVIEESLMRVQICEKAEELKDIVPEKKSTLNENQSEVKEQSLLQKNVNKRDSPKSHGYSDKKNLLKVGSGVTQRGRSTSPQKSASRFSEEHLEKIPSPLKNDPKRRPRDRSLSPRKGENKSSQISNRAGSGQDHCRKSRGRSSSPKKQQKIEGSKDQSNAEAKLLEGESRKVTGHASDNAEQIPDGKEKSGVIRKDTKQSQLEKAEQGLQRKKAREWMKSLFHPKRLITLLVE
ncbi:PREDICTED: LOW QUALITY PROTEIN: membrane-associated guanylate kinase, WW and PDZ domain-containing protein 3, partial [Galeopterus variegatus]|uniref:LOW QUALITY PROTEIN: membrane-associated guanylate kinase, WW and PDZ domain-containing protein 3 n=1 Tax=Galeopterus variegatus TaxID=482537 RepID=A0ABM0QWF6_GALVR